MNIKTELPKEPGVYWWREMAGGVWYVLLLRDCGYGCLSVTPGDGSRQWWGRTLNDWTECHGIGFWSRIPTPDEAANDPVRMAAEAMLEAFKNAEPNWHESVQDLEDALEATK